MDNLPKNRNEVQSYLLVNALRILKPEECINLAETLIAKSSKNEFSKSSVISDSDFECYNETQSSKGRCEEWCKNVNYCKRTAVCTCNPKLRDVELRDSVYYCSECNEPI